MSKVIIIGHASVGTTTLTGALIDNEDIIVVGAEEAKNLGLGEPEPMLIKAPPMLPEIDYMYDVVNPKRKKNRKKRNNTFGQSKYF